MKVPSRPSYSKMSRRGISPGWAAVDLKQRQKQGLELEADADPYPPLSSSMTPLPPVQNTMNNYDPAGRSFSSLLLPSLNLSSLTDVEDSEILLQVGNSSGEQSNECNKEHNVIESYNKLEKLHCSADRGLIEDLMATVDNDVDKASALLKAMGFGNVQETNEIETETTKSKMDDSSIETDALQADKGVLAVEIAHNQNHENGGTLPLTNDFASPGERVPDDNAQMKLILSQLRFVPVEPEWEEDDIYLIHRKDALKMMRLASQHSRAACDAYLRGDHFSAQQSSLKAREEWMAAERLNAKAAREILSLRNIENDMWKLDLHGLHAAEAVQALQEHLQKIESEVLSPCLAPSKKVNAEAATVNPISLEPYRRLDVYKLDTKTPSSRLRSTSLEVITGKGNHSRGEAALPVAIRSFLDENRYRYEEARPGVITVWPKLRYQ